MLNTPEQFAQIHQEALDTLQAVALKSFEGFEKLAELNMQAIKASIAESNDQAKAVLSAKDAKAIANLATANGQPAAEKIASYSKHVYEIANATSAEIVKLFEKQVAEGNKQFAAAVDAMAKNAPAGSEGVVTFVKSAVSAANTAYDQVNKATRQVVEMAESNLASVSKTARPTGKKAA
jgi:phasin family protein